ncbi:ATP synthase subunit I [Psychrobacter pygoscelis]|uniref:ATP synthase subunit I n=1 Tax=Psychrobacter pygoscelis TaxID=2488563 RepID=UPI00103CD9D4|nr:ATP synthase subunit I [Psychrobacter pygoscelis]
MSQPAKRTQSDQVLRAIKGQLWVLFILILLALLVDIFWLDSQKVIAKSLAVGALLSFVSQAIFAWFVFHRTGYHARRTIVHQMYRGQMIKWAVTLSGFIVIFINIRPLSAPALFTGFMLMQISHSWMLWRLR